MIYEVWGEDSTGEEQYLWSFQTEQEALRYIYDNKDEEDYSDLWVVALNEEGEW